MNSRNRSVLFRVTEDEYNSLKVACYERGARNLSEFTRSELMGVLKSESLVSVIRRRFFDVDCKLADLQASVDALGRRLEGRQAAAGSNSSAGED